MISVTGPHRLNPLAGGRDATGLVTNAQGTLVVSEYYDDHALYALTSRIEDEPHGLPSINPAQRMLLCSDYALVLTSERGWASFVATDDGLSYDAQERVRKGEVFAHGSGRSLGYVRGADCREHLVALDTGGEVMILDVPELEVRTRYNIATSTNPTALRVTPDKRHVVLSTGPTGWTVITMPEHTSLR